MIMARVAREISASRASFASATFVMPMTSNPSWRLALLSALVENAGPSMFT